MTPQWTKTLPSVEGYYWWSRDGKDSDVCYVWLQRRDFGEWVATYCNLLGRDRTVKENGGLWAGPIAPPGCIVTEGGLVVEAAASPPERPSDPPPWGINRDTAELVRFDWTTGNMLPMSTTDQEQLLANDKSGHVHAALSKARHELADRKAIEQATVGVPLYGEPIRFLMHECVQSGGAYIHKDRAISECFAGWACYQGENAVGGSVGANRVGVALNIEVAIDFLKGNSPKLFSVPADPQPTPTVINRTPIVWVGKLPDDSSIDWSAMEVDGKAGEHVFPQPDAIVSGPPPT